MRKGLKRLRRRPEERWSEEWLKERIMGRGKAVTGRPDGPEISHLQGKRNEAGEG